MASSPNVILKATSFLVPQVGKFREEKFLFELVVVFMAVVVVIVVMVVVVFVVVVVVVDAVVDAVVLLVVKGLGSALV